MKFYTGFPDFDTLIIFYVEVLKDDAEEMRLWKGKDDQVWTAKQVVITRTFFYDTGATTLKVGPCSPIWYVAIIISVTHYLNMDKFDVPQFQGYCAIPIMEHSKETHARDL